MKKLPYIPDKQLYAAVMFACKMVRENGYFNKDCDIAANYYNVDVEEVKRYVRIAQGNGQKRANRKKPKIKYKWYVIFYVPDFEAEDDCGTCNTWDYSVQELLRETRTDIKRAVNSYNLRTALLNSKNYQPGWGTYFRNNFKILEFDTKKEAEHFIETVTPEEITEWIRDYFTLARDEVQYE